MGTVKLDFRIIPVSYINGVPGDAHAEGNNACWPCQCGYRLWLLGRCYFQFGHTPQTICPSCGATYEVLRDSDKKACEVLQK